ncbi:MAG: polymorphic toxin type 23 domain-containing protein [Chitinophagaceae bacterium]
MRVVRYIVTCFIFLSSNQLGAQQQASFITYPRIGLSCSFGTHVQRVGLHFALINVYRHWQSVLSIQPTWARKSYGKRQARFELQCSEAIQYAFGQKKQSATWIENNMAFNTNLQNRTNYAYSMGYAWKQYIDNASSSQASAILFLNVQNTFLAMENDLFLFSYLDRYRTGAFTIQHTFFWNPYPTTLSLHFLMFTGNTLSNKAKLVMNENTKSSYIDMSEAPLGQYSHGIVSIGIAQALAYKQSCELHIGIDDERIRNRVQNKWMHDQIFLPKAWRKPNAHIPMLDTNGKPYIDPSTQKLKKATLYLQWQSNGDLFW